MKEKKKKKAGEKATSLCTQGYPTESTSVIAHNLHPNVSHFSSISEPTLQYIYTLYIPPSICTYKYKYKYTQVDTSIYLFFLSIEKIFNSFIFQLKFNLPQSCIVHLFSMYFLPLIFQFIPPFIVFLHFSYYYFFFLRVHFTFQSISRCKLELYSLPRHSHEFIRE